MMNDRALTAVGCHIYAGGFTVGVKRAGFNVLCHLEGDGAYGASSAQLNWPDLEVHHGPARWPREKLRDRGVDFLYANPPCAIFSAMGIRSTRGQGAWRTDPRLACWMDVFGAFEIIRPRAFALESVTQAYSAGRDLIDELSKKSLMAGYSVTHLLLDAKWHGIPQSRKRFFLVCHRQPLLVGYQPNWSPPPTVGEVLSEVPEPGWSLQGYLQEKRPDLLELLKDTAPGALLSDTFDRVTTDIESRRTAKGVTGRPSFRHGRLHPDRVTGAYVGGDLYHPTENRIIGIQESKAICGYPPDFQLAPPEKEWASLLARAVMPPVGFWLARAIATTLTQREARSPTERRVTLLDVREPDRAPVDLTSLYLNETGRVRLKVRTDGSLVYATSGGASSPVARARLPAAAIVPSVTQGASHEGLPSPLPRVADRLPADHGGTPDDSARSRALGVREGEVPAETPAPARAEGGTEVVEEPGHPWPLKLDGEGSGAFIKRLWRTTELAPDEIVAAVHANWSGRTTKTGDVYYNYSAMVKAGEVIRPWPKRTTNRGRPTVVAPATRDEAAVATAATRGLEAIAPRRRVTEPRRPVEDGRPRFLVTGCTPIQVGSERTELKIITSTRAMVAALEELGFAVDWRGITPGEDLEEYAGCLVYLQKFNSIACSYYPGALWTILRRPDSILGMDDWQTHTIKAGFDTFARSRERAFRLHGEGIGEVERDVLFKGLTRYAALERWPHPTIVPVFDGGRPQDLRVPAELISIDPTAFSPRYPHEPGERERAWVQASLLVKSPPSGTAWPVTYFGNAGAGYGGVGKSLVREPQPRIPEPELMRVYARHRGVLSPPHDHPASGWWRVRYLMAADAGCVLSAHPDEARVLGEPYTLASNVPYVESLSDSALDDLAAAQAECLARRTLPREEVLSRLREVLSAQGVRLPQENRDAV